MGKNCGFADEAGNCLIKQTLECYVKDKREQAAREIAKLEEQNRLIRLQAINTHIINNPTTVNNNHDNYSRINAIEDGFY